MVINIAGRSTSWQCSITGHVASDGMASVTIPGHTSSDRYRFISNTGLVP